MELQFLFYIPDAIHFLGARMLMVRYDVFFDVHARMPICLPPQALYAKLSASCLGTFRCTHLVPPVQFCHVTVVRTMIIKISVRMCRET